MPTPSAPLKVGLIGAGPWARMVHAPNLAAHPGTELTAVWTRRASQAEEVAAAHGGTACATLEELFGRCEAVVFAIPPDRQAEIALDAAAAGKAMLLEKPLALDVTAARRVADAAAAAGVGTQMVLTWRYARAVRGLLAGLGPHPAGARAWFLSGAANEGPFATPWRREHGALFDIGPHVLDLLQAALGPIDDVRAVGSTNAVVSLALAHRGGAASTASLSVRLPAGYDVGFVAYDEAGEHPLDLARGSRGDDNPFATMLDEFVATARGAAHPLDAAHGVRLQEVLRRAADELGIGGH